MRTGSRTKKGSRRWKGFLTRTGFRTGKDSLRWKGFLMRMARQMK